MQLSIDSNGLRLGAAVSAAELGENAELIRLWPGLAEAAALIGSTQIQGRGSLGGNLCNASPAADTPCSLIVNRAECVIAGPAGERTIPVEQFILGPGKTVLARGEFLVTIRVPRPTPHTADAYLRLIPRSEMDIAVVGSAVSLTLDADGVCTAARVALAAVAPTPVLVPDAAEALIGSRLDDGRVVASGSSGERCRAAYRRQAGNDRISASDRRRADETRRGHCVPSRERWLLRCPGFMSIRPSTASRSNFSATDRKRCSARFVTPSA